MWHQHCVLQIFFITILIGRILDNGKRSGNYAYWQWSFFLGELGIIFTLIWAENVTLGHLQFWLDICGNEGVGVLPVTPVLSSSWEPSCGEVFGWGFPLLSYNNSLISIYLSPLHSSVSDSGRCNGIGCECCRDLHQGKGLFQFTQFCSEFLLRFLLHGCSALLQQLEPWCSLLPSCSYHPAEFLQ